MDAIEREITLPASLDEAWDLLTRPEELAAWLGDDVVLDATPGAAGHIVERDGSHRSLVVEEVRPGERLAWRWWPTDDGDGGGDGAVSRVEITLTPGSAGTTVRVVEHLDGPAQVRASAADAWAHRLLHLEALLLIAASVRG